MSMPPDDVSRDTLERLVTRALELDASRTERIDFAKAREIARELGISDSAWDAAVAERTSSAIVHQTVRKRIWMRIRTLLISGAGFTAGALGAWVSTTWNGNLDVAYAALLVLGGIVAWIQTRDSSSTEQQTSLDAWWLPVPVGMLLTFGEIRTDPLLFAAFARWGTGAFVSQLPRLLRFLREADPGTSTSTA